MSLQSKRLQLPASLNHHMNHIPIALFLASLVFISACSAESDLNQGPTPPSNVSTEAIPGGILVTWQYGGENNGFVIYRKDNETNAFFAVGDALAEDRSFTDSPPSEAETYSYAVTVKDDMGRESSLTEQQGPALSPLPEIDAEPPVINAFSANPATADAGTEITFSWDISDADSDSLSCSLDPGDGSDTYELEDCSSETVQNHSYSEPGNYTATLRVSDESESSAVATTAVTISSATEETFSVTSIEGLVADWSGETAFLLLTGFDPNAVLEDSEFSVSTEIGSDGSFSFDDLPAPSQSGLTYLTFGLVSEEDQGDLSIEDLQFQGRLESATGAFVVWIYSRGATTRNGDCLEGITSDCNLTLAAGWNSALAQEEGGTLSLLSASIGEDFSWEFFPY